MYIYIYLYYVYIYRARPNIYRQQYVPDAQYYGLEPNIYCQQYGLRDSPYGGFTITAYELEPDCKTLQIARIRD